jgi:hypothetical protein
MMWRGSPIPLRDLRAMLSPLRLFLARLVRESSFRAREPSSALCAL